MSYKAIKRYINPRNDRLKENILSKDADYLPTRHRNWQSFKKSFSENSNYNFEFMGYSLVVNCDLK